jgi:hypothetical protein
MVSIRQGMVSLSSVLLFVGATSFAAGCGGSDTAIDQDSGDLTETDGTLPLASAALDFGIYWFGLDNASQKAVAGAANPFYDPSRPTVIHIHGWQPGSTQAGRRETFNYATNDPTNGVDIDLADAWVKKGWNIGIFYWNQFADEDTVWNAEAKIWSTNGPKGMRFRKKDGTYETVVTTKTVADLFADTYVSVLGGQKNGTIRLTGHSLGNQMVVRGAKLVSDRIAAGTAPALIQPKRIALLDPFWSNGGKDFLGGKWTGEMTRRHVTELMSRGIMFERYKTSSASEGILGDNNAALTTLIGNTEIRPEYIKGSDVTGRHVAAPNLYFQSFASAPPAGCFVGQSGAKDCSGVAPSAATNDDAIATLMRSRFNWVQSRGTATEDPSDNVFDRIAR